MVILVDINNLRPSAKIISVEYAAMTIFFQGQIFPIAKKLEKKPDSIVSGSFYFRFWENAIAKHIQNTISNL